MPGRGVRLVQVMYGLLMVVRYSLPTMELRCSTEHSGVYYVGVVSIGGGKRKTCWRWAYTFLFRRNENCDTAAFATFHGLSSQFTSST